MYAYFKVSHSCFVELHRLMLWKPQKLDYHSTECIYSPTAYRGHARALVKDLEAVRPSSILDIIYSGEAMGKMVKVEVKRPIQKVCERCGAMASQQLCQACALLDSLNKGVARIELDKADIEKKVESSMIPQEAQ